AEAATASGSGVRTAYPWLHRVLVVDVPVEVQRSRLLARDGIDAALADRMIAAQATRAERLAIADDVLVNDGALEQLPPHVAALDARYRALAAAAGWSRYQRRPGPPPPPPPPPRRGPAPPPPPLAPPPARRGRLRGRGTR